MRKWSVRKLLSFEIEAERQVDEHVIREDVTLTRMSEQLRNLAHNRNFDHTATTQTSNFPTSTFVLDSIGVTGHGFRGRTMNWVAMDDMVFCDPMEQIRMAEDRLLLERMNQAITECLPAVVAQPAEDELDRRYNEAVTALMADRDSLWRSAYGSENQHGPSIVDARSGHTLGREVQRQRRELNRALGITPPPQRPAAQLVNPNRFIARGDIHFGAPATDTAALNAALSRIEYGSSNVIRMQRSRTHEPHEIQFNGHRGRVDPASLSNPQQ